MGVADQSLALTNDHYFSAGSSTIYRFDANRTWLNEKQI
jgi:hypothetical protein